nr:paired-like class homeodomain transcription factor Pmar1/Phb1 related [Patiria pectinifera]
MSSAAVYLEGASRPDVQGATMLHHRSMTGVIGESTTAPRSRPIDGVFGLFKSMPTPPSIVTTQSQRVPLEPSAVQTPSAAVPSKRAVGGGRRRARTNYTPEQLSGLETLFAKTQYPGIDEREALADAVDLSEARVQVWFQNRRARLRRRQRDSVSGASSPESVSPKAPEASPSKPAKKSKPSGPKIPSQSASPPSAPSPPSASPPSPAQHRYLEVCTQACCAPAAPQHSARPHILQHSGAQYITGASKGYYPWASLGYGAFQPGVAQGYHPYTYLYPGASPFYLDYTLPLPAASASYPAVSIQDVTHGLDSSTILAPTFPSH